MNARMLICVALAGLLAACSTPQNKKAAEAAKAKGPTMEDVSGDVNFQAFVGRLRKAVAAHDMQTVAEMMTTNFGYRLDPIGEGDGVFQYWDDNVLWSQLLAVVNQNWAPKGEFMVAPPAFATDPNFHGYRAGITLVDGSWKFAYFVTD